MSNAWDVKFGAPRSFTLSEEGQNLSHKSWANLLHLIRCVSWRREGDRSEFLCCTVHLRVNSVRPQSTMCPQATGQPMENVEHILRFPYLRIRSTVYSGSINPRIVSFARSNIKIVFFLQDFTLSFFFTFMCSCVSTGMCAFAFGGGIRMRTVASEALTTKRMMCLHRPHTDHVIDSFGNFAMLLFDVRGVPHRTEVVGAKSNPSGRG